MPLSKAVEKMRGKPGTPVVLTVVRKDAEAPLTFTLMREEINVKSVRAKMIEPGYGYIRVAPVPGTHRRGPRQGAHGPLQAGRAQGPRARPAQRSGRPAEPGGRRVAAFLPKDALVVYTDGRTPDARMRLTADQARTTRAAATTT